MPSPAFTKYNQERVTSICLSLQVYRKLSISYAGGACSPCTCGELLLFSINAGDQVGPPSCESQHSGRIWLRDEPYTVCSDVTYRVSL